MCLCAISMMPVVLIYFRGSIMGVSQINQSFQNDGNFSLLDLKDEVFDGPIMRIETFRCSQPAGEYGVTAVGSAVKNIAGKDHLAKNSNKTFRHIFSVGSINDVKCVLEIRESFDVNGSMEVRMRDVDCSSSSFGTVIICQVNPVPEGLNVDYAILEPGHVVKQKLTSPVLSSVSEQTGLIDLSADVECLGVPVNISGCKKFSCVFFCKNPNDLALSQLDDFSKKVREIYPQWTKNVEVYERMGDFRDKCIHFGTNLTGDEPALASEFVIIRAYRMSLITMARIFDVCMSAGAHQLNINKYKKSSSAILDTKPGVYAVFLSAYALNIGIYQLGLDKVHSDYGGIPMKIKPGSRLENGIEPIVDATNLNRMLALMAGVYYAPDAINNIINIKPSIVSFVKNESVQINF